MTKKTTYYTEEEIDNIIKGHGNLPGCKDSIMIGACKGCMSYNDEFCPFYASEYEWNLNMPYTIKYYDGELIFNEGDE